jgi:hypothetical protein
MTQMLLKETPTRTPAPQSPKRRWVRFAAPVAGAAIVLAIAAGVLIARSSDVPEPVKRQAQEVNASDRHLLNQAAMLQRRRASSHGSDTDVLNAATLHQMRRTSSQGSDTDVFNQARGLELRRVDDERFAGRYSQPTPERNGSDRHLLNQARKVE